MGLRDFTRWRKQLVSVWGHVADKWRQPARDGGVNTGITVGVIRNETLVFINFSAQDASILKISVPISKRRS